MSDRLPPTQDLCMEVLAARYRLGEVLWTFDARCVKALDALASRGWVVVMSGNVEHTVRASLTDKGVEAWHLDRDYRSPSDEDVREAMAQAIQEVVTDLKGVWDAMPEPTQGLYRRAARKALKARSKVLSRQVR